MNATVPPPVSVNVPDAAVAPPGGVSVEERKDNGVADGSKKEEETSGKSHKWWWMLTALLIFAAVITLVALLMRRWKRLRANRNRIHVERSCAVLSDIPLARLSLTLNLTVHPDGIVDTDVDAQVTPMTATSMNDAQAVRDGTKSIDSLSWLPTDATPSASLPTLRIDATPQNRSCLFLHLSSIGWKTSPISSDQWPTAIAASQRFVRVIIREKSQTHSSRRSWWQSMHDWLEPSTAPHDWTTVMTAYVPVQTKPCEPLTGDGDVDFQLIIPRTSDISCDTTDGPAGQFIMSTLPAGPQQASVASHAWDTLSPPVGIVVPRCPISLSATASYRFRVEARSTSTHVAIARSAWDKWSSDRYPSKQWLQHTLRLVGDAETLQQYQTMYENLKMILVMESTPIPGPDDVVPPTTTTTDFVISHCPATIWVNHTFPSMNWWATFVYSLRRQDTRQLLFSCLDRVVDNSSDPPTYSVKRILPPAPVPILLPPHILSTVLDPSRVVYLVVQQNDTVFALAALGTVANLLVEQPTSIRMAQFEYQRPTPVPVAADPALDDDVTLCTCRLVVSASTGYNSSDEELLSNPFAPEFEVEVVLRWCSDI